MVFKLDDRSRREKEVLISNIMWVSFSAKEAKVNPYIEEQPNVFITLLQINKNIGEMRLPRRICYALIMLGINRETPFILMGQITSPYT